VPKIVATMKFADPSIQLGRAYLDLFFEMAYAASSG
jgi:hypothetical protein